MKKKKHNQRKRSWILGDRGVEKTGIEDMHRLFFTNSQGVVSNPEANENVGQIKDEDGHETRSAPRRRHC
jgi:hypothetical protein